LVVVGETPPSPLPLATKTSAVSYFIMIEERLFFIQSRKIERFPLRYSGVYVFQIVNGDLIYNYIYIHIYTLAGGVVWSGACVFAPYGCPARASNYMYLYIHINMY